MLRLIHSFDVKPGVDVESFVEWLDHELWVRSEPFGCTERKTWIYLDGIDGTYEHGRPAKRPPFGWRAPSGGSGWSARTTPKGADGSIACCRGMSRSRRRRGRKH